MLLKILLTILVALTPVIAYLIAYLRDSYEHGVGVLTEILIITYTITAVSTLVYLIWF